MVRGVIDSDYIGEIKVLFSPPTKTVQINKGQRVTQPLLLPYYQTRKNLTSQVKSHETFGSSDLAFWVQEITAPGQHILLRPSKHWTLPSCREVTGGARSDLRLVAPEPRPSPDRDNPQTL